MRCFYIAAALLMQAFMLHADTFSDVMNTIVANNLTEKYSVASDAAKIEGMRGENTLDAPDVEFEHVWGGKGIGNKWSFSVSQSFDWPGVYAARREAIHTSQTAMQYLRESALMDVRMEVRLALVDIIYTRQKINAITVLAESMDRLVETYRAAVERGEQTRLDYNKAVIEKIYADRELKSLEGEYDILVSSLESLNGGKDVNELLKHLGDEYPGWTLADLVPNPELIRKRDPQYAAAMAALEAGRLQANVAKLSLYPGFSVGYVHENEQGEKYNGFSIGMSLPFLYGKNKVKASRFETEALALDAEIQLTQRMGELTGLYKQAVVLGDFVDKYEKVIHDESNLQLLKKAFDGGQISFLTYLQEVHYFYLANNDYLDTRHQYQQALAKLSRYQ